MKIDYYKPFLQTVESNTDANLHTENCVLIAVNFGTKTHLEHAKEIEQDHNKRGSMNYFVQLARTYLINDILNNMSNKKLSREIYKRL
jgi:tRNA(Ile2) C34 agmatinyltransferase TiaS